MWWGVLPSVVGRMRQLNTGPQTGNRIKATGPAFEHGWKGGKPLYPCIFTSRNSPNSSSEENLFPLPISSPALCLVQAWLSPGT